jgi:hypothetical protein
LIRCHAGLGHIGTHLQLKKSRHASWTQTYLGDC